MKIESIKIKNFKAFKNAEMKDIPRFCVIIGANGSGKTTLFNVFGFLKDALSTNVNTAFEKRGGFNEVISRSCNDNIEFEIKFRAKDTYEKNPIITYSLSIAQENGKAIVDREILKYRRGQHGNPWKFLDFSRGEGEAVINEKMLDSTEETDLKREGQTLRSPDILAIKGLSQFVKFPAVIALSELIDNWHVSDIHVNEARNIQQANYAEHLSTLGENLSNVIDYLHNNHKPILDNIINTLKQRIPGISKVEVQTIETGQVLLKIQDESFDKPFLVRYISDGTIKMLAYLVLLYDPKPYPLLCVEEPENQLYPHLLEELAEEFRAYADRGEQVFVSTHSPDFLNAVEIDEVFLLVKDKGYTTIKRASKNEQIKTYMENGDKMGYLWKQGFFNNLGKQCI
ncbi:chromosome segregation protein SMC [Bathymodiolus thermophilus thioautotrophic gill symbiont]|uniref:Chromosome segregation protein SMC n=1 Tax=Bathymodiolus thermophilus thioautotrophic gill symbiont TaxID=2360 RepID=A0A3G3IKQ1_9GAMM|nr:AAA family ATPase [Bathymodiolus thermophilus thioautotrophic gill symbiont]AYQ56288.1 chromosome segregation protein SMC [Bathymodiolus thermophilus thioautotrophic gill symbiont]